MSTFRPYLTKGFIKMEQSGHQPPSLTICALRISLSPYMT